jgi:ribonuclease R
MTKKSPPPDKQNFNNQNKLYQNLSKTIQQFLEGRNYVPMGQTALLKRLKIPSEHHSLCKQVLSDLVADGIIEVRNKQFVVKKPEPDVVTGTLRMHPRGFGFVIPDHPSECPQDIFIPKHLVDNAVDGDKVEIAINPDSNSEKGPEGRIICILKRGRSHLGGTIRDIDTNGNLIAHVPLLGASKPVVVHPKNEMVLKVGDRVILKVLQWGNDTHPTLGEVSHYIGHITDPSCDIEAAIEEFDLRNHFGKAAIKDATSFGSKVSKKDLKGRVDLSKMTCFTIDPDTARDYDDALSLTKDKNGNYHLGVHIADVAHYIPPSSSLDLEAYERCNSTYFPGACIPMLPEELSNELCSLKAKVIRLTVSVLMEFDDEGSLLGHKIVRSYIKSSKRFTYQEAKEVLDGKKKSPFSASLKLMVDLCLLLKKKRYERGSIDFSLPDMSIEIDKKGQPTGIKIIEYDITHQLVEEFMLKANEVVAKHLSDKGKGLLYRIHEEPSSDNFQDFFNLARTLGFSLPSEPTTKDIQKLFNEAKHTSYAAQLSIGFIRSMKLAYYSPDNVGHYGLSLEHYCHFTSPIRRYTDLITERLLFDEEGENLDLHKVALKCSEQERISFRAETSVKILKKLRLLQILMKEDPERQYSAVVTRLKPFGLFFEIPEIMLEGFLHISQLENDYFFFDQQRNLLVGRSSGRVHRVGEPIKVQASSLNLILLESKWTLVTSAPRQPKQSHDNFKRKDRRRNRK